MNKISTTIRISSDNIQSLDSGEVFVFGSNIRGIHGAGAAQMANKLFGAEMGVGIGVTGDCYAIPTKDSNLRTLPITVVEEYIKDFIEYAYQTPDKIFLVTEVGCGLAGFSVKEIAPLFRRVLNCKNVYLPKTFIKELL